MFKVLKEVRDDVIDVMISSDGSWKSIMESDDHTEKPKDKTPDFAQDSPQRGSDGLSNAHSDVLDLTEIDDEMNPMTTAETENSKSLASINVQNTTVVINQSEISQTGASYVANDFWPGMYLTSLQTGGASEPARANFLQPPVLTDTISPALNPEGNGLIPTSVLQSGSSPNILQLQQFQFGNSSISNEYGMFPSASRDVNGTPVAVTAQMQTPVCHQRQQNTMNPLFHTGPSAATQDLRTESLDGSNLRSVLERQQFSFPGLNLLQARMTSSALPQQMTAQTITCLYMYWEKIEFLINETWHDTWID